MTDCISREDLLKRLKKVSTEAWMPVPKPYIIALSHNKCGNDENDIAVQTCIETIKKLPTVELISREEVLNLIDTAFENGAFDGRYAYENLVDAVQNLIHPLETDLVSRQAVIDTIETDCSWDMFNEWGSRTPVGESIIEAIKRVPSVEPEKCGDCISRAALRQKIINHFEKTDGLDIVHSYSITLLNFANDLPSVEPKRKTGKWFFLDECANEGWYCDQCHKKVFKADFSNTMRKYKFCPNCGAKMEVDK